MSHLKRILIIVITMVLVVVNVRWSFPIETQRDFTTFVTAGWAANQGLNPYESHPALFPPDVGNAWLNLNPPVSLLFFQPLARLDPALVASVWYILTLVTYAVALWLLSRAYPEHALVRSALALCMMALWTTAFQRQIYTFLLLSTVGAWLLLRSNRLVAAGVLIGVLVAIKPYFVLWPVLLLCAGYLPVAVAALVSAAILSLLPALVYGPQIYNHWLDSLDFVAITDPYNISLWAVLEQLNIGWLSLPLILAMLLLLAWWAWKGEPDSLHVSEIAVACSLFFAPFIWIGYTMLLLPGLFARRPWSVPLTIILLCLTTPFIRSVLPVLVPASAPSRIGAGVVFAIFVVLLLVESRVFHTVTVVQRSSNDPSYPS